MSDQKLPDWLLDCVNEQKRSACAEQSFNGVPALIDNFTAFKSYWQWQCALLLSMIDQDIKELKWQKQNLIKEKIGKERAIALIAAQEVNRASLRELLKLPLEEGVSALRQKGSGPLFISQDFENIFRDWAWPEVEIKAHLEAILPTLPKLEKGAKVLLVGAGSCRLAFDIFKSLGDVKMISTDINPLLISAADKVLSGETINLYEVPPCPFEKDKTAKEWNIKSKESAPESFQIVYQDFREDIFADECFDLVITPWFLDVVDMPIEKVIHKLAKLLKPSGQWVNFGPLMFNTQNRTQRWTIEEIMQLSKAVGFKNERLLKNRVPQICSPVNGFGREIDVYSWAMQRGEKLADQKNLPELSKPFELPEYLTNPKLPVTLNISLDEAIQSHTLMADVLHEAKQSKSINDISAALAKKYGSAPEAIQPIVTKLVNDFFRMNFKV